VLVVGGVVVVVVFGVLVVVFGGVLVVVFGGLVVGGGVVDECVAVCVLAVVGVEWLELVLEVELCELPPRASAAPPPSSSAAMTAISAHRPVRLWRGGGSVGGGWRASRGLGGIGVCRTRGFGSGSTSGVGDAGMASIGTVAAVGAAAAIASVVSASPC